MPKRILVAAILTIAFCVALAASQLHEWNDPRTVGGTLKVEWVGKLVRAKVVPAESRRGDGTRAMMREAYLAAFPDETIDVGLRSDGVLVWRKTHQE